VRQLKGKAALKDDAQQMTAEQLASLSEEAARLIAGGGGVRAIAKLLAQRSGGAVLVEDEQWRHVASAEAARGVGPLPPSFSSFYREPRGGTRNGIVVHAAISGSLHGLCIAIPSGEGETCAGYITLFVRGKNKGDFSPALRIVASAAALESLRRGAGRGQARRQFWDHYLGGQIADASDLKAQAHAAGVPLPPAFVAGVFDCDGAPPTWGEMLQQSLAPADAVCPVPSASNQVIALFPVRHKVDVTRARQAAANAVRDLPAALGVHAVNCGIGAFHADLLDVPRSVSEARLALSLGRRLFGKGSVAVYPDLGIYALLHGGASRDAFAAFADALVEPLVEYDRKHKTDLLATLQLYFEVGENVKEAAERLSVHRHTIFYRLNQISQILKTDLKTPKGQLSLRAALAIRQMNPREETHE
jgi:hypothetical protein